ncbi:MAG: 16S rRNA (cytosine(1402)-N(4))-methyltransferase RsmH [Deltaproteobacteria bacterium]|nr:16S rRNA (cytosine(1402)-N(4))-methyltransferase RsmH [Deltaproteobacteria bacterium]
MAREVSALMQARPGGVYVDATLGAGGHAADMLRSSSPDGRVIGFDVDEDAITEAKKILNEFAGRVTIVRESYVNMREELTKLGIEKVDGVLFDFGTSSMQMDDAKRGFSFRFDEMLDMRMDNRGGLTAYDVVNTYGVEELTRVFRDYGEERRASAIARAIVRQREGAPIRTTAALSRIVEASYPPSYMRKEKIHPATRVFQAIRIEVNNELGNVKAGLDAALGVLKGGGRLIAISFHSLEDRIVKERFRSLISPCACPRDLPVCACGKKPVVAALTKKALTASEDEVNSNPRARSAKLRAVEKL